MIRPFLPFLRLARVAWLAPSLGLALAIASGAAPPVTTAPIVTTTPMGPAAAAAPEATGAARKNAEALFSRYVDLEHAFDPALVDLYAPGAHIQRRVIVPGRPPRIDNWAGTQYKELLRNGLAKAKKTGQDLNFYSAVTYLGEGNRVRIKARRFARLENVVTPVEILVGPDLTGSWRIFEELSEDHPLVAAPPRKP
jgi:hypothetical protein